MKKAQAIMVIAIAIPLLLTLISCEKLKEKSLRIIDFVKIDKETKLDDVLDSFIGPLVFSPLLFRDYENGAYSVHYVLAEEIKVLPDKKSIEVRIRDGVRFHDGRPLTAYDMVASFKRIRDEIGDEKLNGMEAKAVDRLRFVLAGKAPVTDPENLLTGIFALPPPGADLLIGTGPFRLKRFINDGVELEANKDYFEGRPKLDGIVYLLDENEEKRVARVLKGEADLLAGLPSAGLIFFERDPQYRVIKDVLHHYVALFLNTESPFFSDKKVRQAVNMAIDRNTLIDKIRIPATPACGPFLKEMLPDGHGCQSYPYNPNEAVKIMQAAGWKDSDGNGVVEKNGKEFRIALYFMSDEEVYKKTAWMVAQQLFEVGIGAEVVPVFSYIDFMKNQFPSGGYDAVLMMSNEFQQDAMWQSPARFGANSVNQSRYKNIELDMLFDELKKTGDRRKSMEIYAGIDRILHEDAPAAFLYNPASYSVVRKIFSGAERFCGSLYEIYKIKDWERL